MTQDIIIAKGTAALENERTATERKEAAKAAIEAYKTDKTPLQVLANPVVTYEYSDKEYSTVIDASAMLPTEKSAIYGNRSAKAAYTALLNRLADCVAADVSRKLENNAPRIDRNKGLEVLKQCATILGYTNYNADKRDFDYIVMGMTGINKDADLAIKAARKAVNSLFRIKLNGGNVRVMMQGGVEYSNEYMQTKQEKEREIENARKEKEKIAREKAEAKAAKAKAKELEEKEAAKEERAKEEAKAA